MEFDLVNGIAILERTPGTLRAMLDGLPAAWLTATEGPETWSPSDVVAHLAHAERTNWIPRATVILNQGSDRRFPAFDRFAHLRRPGYEPIADLLDDFDSIRAVNLATLRAWDLTDERLQLAGEHPELGSVTLRQLLATWVAHDLGHTAQIVRVMARQYGEAVGPWSAYLSILRR